MRGAYSAVATLIALLMESVAFATSQEKLPEAQQTKNSEVYGPPAPFVRKLSSASETTPLVWPPPPASVLVAPVATTAPAAGLPNAAILETAPALPPPPQSYGPFVLEERMVPRVKFWVDIYAKYSSWEFCVHHVKYPQLVYSVFSTKGKPKGALEGEKARIVKLLRGLAGKWKLIAAGKLKREKLSKEEESLLALFEKNNLLDALPKAGDLKLLRGQAGLKDGLKDALFMSGRYLPRMEAVFARFGLPMEIAHLPFVESGFNKRAVSKVGASGIWQFMPYTGKLYLRVDDEVDERNDPMRAAEAAARLMQQNYNLLDSWPLAITAYNHGAAGVAKAAKEVGSKNIADIIDKFEGKSFGFASQNFYASFLAALHVTRNSQAFLGDLPRARILEFDEFVLPHYIELKVFLEKFQLEETAFKELNPALTADVYNGKKYMPVGYTIRLPSEVREDFFKKYGEIPAYQKFGQQKPSVEPPGLAASAVGDPEAAGLVISDQKTK